MTEPKEPGRPEPDARAVTGARRSPPQPRVYPEFTRRLLLVMLLYAAGLKLVNAALSAMLVPPGAVELITLLLLLGGLGALVAYYFGLGPFRPTTADD